MRFDLDQQKQTRDNARFRLQDARTQKAKITEGLALVKQDLKDCAELERGAADNPALTARAQAAKTKFLKEEQNLTERLAGFDNTIAVCEKQLAGLDNKAIEAGERSDALARRLGTRTRRGDWSKGL